MGEGAQRPKPSVTRTGGSYMRRPTARVHDSLGRRRLYSADRQERATPVGSRTDGSLIELVTKLSPTLRDGEIARILNMKEFLTPRDLPWTMDRVKSFRAHHRIRKTKQTPAERRAHRATSKTVPGIGYNGLLALIRRGLVHTHQVTDFAPWRIPRAELDSKDVQKLVRVLKKTGRCPAGRDPRTLGILRRHFSQANHASCKRRHCDAGWWRRQESNPRPEPAVASVPSSPPTGRGPTSPKDPGSLRPAPDRRDPGSPPAPSTRPGRPATWRSDTRPPISYHRSLWITTSSGEASSTSDPGSERSATRRLRTSCSRCVGSSGGTYTSALTSVSSWIRLKLDRSRTAR